ncbi:Polycomb group protein EMBRYONIC FLOWER 2 [Ancistrocladus abbreviatus]
MNIIIHMFLAGIVLSESLSPCLSILLAVHVRVLANGHIPWAGKAFSRLQGHDLIRAPALVWCWRLFMIKLWNHGLLDARTMNNCNLILEEFQRQQSNGV